MGLRDCSRTAPRNRHGIGNAPSAAARSRVRHDPCGDFPECRPSAILLPESFSGPCVGPRCLHLRRSSVRGFSLALFFRQDSFILARAGQPVKGGRNRGGRNRPRLDRSGAEARLSAAWMSFSSMRSRSSGQRRSGPGNSCLPREFENPWRTSRCSSGRETSARTSRSS